MRDDRAENRLNDYWNALDRSAPPNEVATDGELLDPGMKATIDQVRALHRRALPDPVFVARLEQDVMRAFEATFNTQLAPAGRNTSGAARVGGATSRTRDWPRPDQRSARVAVIAAVIAAMVLGLIGGAMVYQRLDSTPMPALAPPGTPEATPVEQWSTARGDSARTGVAGSGPVGRPIERWRAQADGSCGQSPAVADGMVYIICGDSLLALDAASGETRWQFEALGFGQYLTLADGVAYAWTGDAVVAISLETHQELWRAPFAANGSLAVVDGAVLAAGRSGELAVFDAATGAQRWVTQRVEHGVASHPAISNGVAYSGGESGDLVAQDLETGNELWRYDTEGVATGTAVIADGIAYIGESAAGNSGHLAALNAEDGSLLWTIDQPIYTPAVLGGAGYSGSANGHIVAFDTRDGGIRWQAEVGPSARPGAVAGAIFYLSSDDDEAIVAFDATTGTELWRVEIAGGWNDTVSVANGALYASTERGLIVAYGDSADVAIGAPGAASPITAATVAAVASPAPIVPTAAAEATVLWSSPGGGQPFAQVNEVTIAPDGKVWVTDGEHSSYQIYAQDGTYLETWGVTGGGDGELNFFRNNGDAYGAIAFLPDGSFYVADTGNHRVQLFDANRQFVRSMGFFGEGPGSLLFPGGVGVDADGNVFTNDYGHSGITKFDKDGNFVTSFGGVGSGADNGEMGVPGFLAIDPEGNVWVGDFADASLHVWDNDGVYLGSVRADGAPITAGLTFDRNGLIYVADMDGGRVIVMTPQGDVIWSWDVSLVAPAGIAVSDDGTIFVSDIVAGTIQAIAPGRSFADVEATPAGS